jgi:integrase
MKINKQTVKLLIPTNAKGQTVTVPLHDLHMIYTRALYDAGISTLDIQQNLGHASSKTTQGYIGSLDASTRRPGMIYSFDLSKLEG